MGESFDVPIVGGGHGLAQAALALRRFKFAGSIAIVGEESELPHDRPPLSKGYLAGGTDEYRAVPWFWSNQYDLHLRSVGVSRGYDETVVRGDPATRAFSAVYVRDGVVLALDCVNSVRGYALAAAGSRPPRAALADPGVALQTLA